MKENENEGKPEWKKTGMKENQNLIGRIIIAAAIVIAGILIANALEHLGGSIGAGLDTIAGQIN